MDHYRWASGPIFVAMACLSSAGTAKPQLTHNPGSSTASGGLNPAACSKDATAVLPCGVRDQLTRAEKIRGEMSDATNLDRFRVSVDRIGDKSEANINKIDAGERQKAQATIKKKLVQAIPLLDGAIAKAPTIQSKHLIQQYKDQYIKCSNGLLWAIVEKDDSYDERTLGCILRLERIGRLVDSALGFKVEPTAPDFKWFHWGDSMEAVIAKEGQPVEQESHELTYSEVIAGRKAKLIYVFVNNHLAKAAYFIVAKHTEFDLYIDDFKAVQNEVVGKYGKPDMSVEDWTNTTFKNDPSYWGLAVASGQMTMLANWHTRVTKVGQMLVGDNFKIQDGVVCSSIEYAQELTQQNQAQKTKPF